MNSKVHINSDSKIQSKHGFMDFTIRNDEKQDHLRWIKHPSSNIHLKSTDILDQWIIMFNMTLKSFSYWYYRKLCICDGTTPGPVCITYNFKWENICFRLTNNSLLIRLGTLKLSDVVPNYLEPWKAFQTGVTKVCASSACGTVCIT